jgi:hypothetical protein
MRWTLSATARPRDAIPLSAVGEEIRPRMRSVWGFVEE